MVEVPAPPGGIFAALHVVILAATLLARLVTPPMASLKGCRVLSSLGDFCTVELRLLARGGAPAVACGRVRVRSRANLAHAACDLAHELLYI